MKRYMHVTHMPSTHSTLPHPPQPPSLTLSFPPLPAHLSLAFRPAPPLRFIISPIPSHSPPSPPIFPHPLPFSLIPSHSPPSPPILPHPLPFSLIPSHSPPSSPPLPSAPFVRVRCAASCSDLVCCASLPSNAMPTAGIQVNPTASFQKDLGPESLDGVDVTPTASFQKDLGLDSLDGVEVVMAFEEEFAHSLAALSFSTAVKGASLSANRVAVAPIVAPRGLGVTALLRFNKAAIPAKTVPAKKQLRTEDGIFGTSGGFGFTKANELFVGRVAMLGFAASLLGEAVTGQGILSQLNLETGIPITEAEPLLLFFIAFTVLGAIGGLGDRGRFVDDEAPAGPPVKPGSVKAALGLSEEGPLFGFTKANELFVGRMAQLGFAASLVGEVITGRGALAQLNIETGLPVWELEPLLLASIAFFFIAAINPGTGKFINDDE
ncbi:unnamed protein product [Closterium sp. NIES-65]|nr:unnamed protein product [Closterium sp. NIES-65]